MANEPIQKYFDALIETYDVLVDAVAKANERGMKVSAQLVKDVAKGQREALELGKKVASEPTDMGGFYTSLLETATAAQGRALAFTQTAYQEALAAGTDARETVEKVVQVNRETVKLAMEAARSFASANPFGEMMKQGFEGFAPAAPKAKKDKAPV